MKVLFICAGNWCRSPTAETLLNTCSRYEAKSAGVSVGARIPVTNELLDWADIVFVMEKWMKQDILKRFLVADDKIKVLEIRDNYWYGHPRLVDKLIEKLQAFGITLDTTCVAEAEEKFVEKDLVWDWTNDSKQSVARRDRTSVLS